MAEMAAALLLVDREDAVARALFDRARAAADAHEGLVDGSDALAGTLALAIASRQLGEDALADTWSASAIARMHLARRASVETRFWALAASAFGALGADATREATLVVDGVDRTLTLETGAVVVDDLPTSSRVSVRASGHVFVRAELRGLVPYVERRAVSIEAHVEGDVGVRGERAGLVLVVEADETAYDEPIVEIQLPPQGALDARAHAAILGSSAVHALDGPDAANVLRLALAPLRAHGTLRVPLPLEWIAAGRARGLGTVVYDRSAPWRTSTSPERIVEVGSP
jgi:hypothetical protein